MENINLINPKNFMKRNRVAWIKVIIFFLILPFLAIPFLGFHENWRWILVIFFPIWPIITSAYCILVILFLKNADEIMTAYLISLLSFSIAAIIFVGLLIGWQKPQTIFIDGSFILMVLLYIFSTVLFRLASFSFRYHIISTLSMALFILMSAIEFLDIGMTFLMLALPLSLLLTYLYNMDHFWVVESDNTSSSKSPKYRDIYSFIRPSIQFIESIDSIAV